MSATAIPDAIPPSVAVRIGMLLRMLGSDADGEKLNAARALDRTLRANGLDWHAVADAVERPAEFRQRPDFYPRERSARPSARAHSTPVFYDYERRRIAIEALRRGRSERRMSEWESEFAESILTRFQVGNGQLTTKQDDALGRLLHRLGERTAWA